MACDLLYIYIWNQLTFERTRKGAGKNDYNKTKIIPLKKYTVLLLTKHSVSFVETNPVYYTPDRYTVAHIGFRAFG